MPKLPWERLAAILFCIAAVAAASFFVGRFLLGALLPFAIGWLLYVAANAPARRLSPMVRLPHRVVSVTLLLLYLAVGSALLWFAASRLLGELERLVTEISASNVGEGGSITDRIVAYLGLPSASDPEASATERLLSSLLGKGIDALTYALTTRLPTLLASLAGKLPDALLFFLLTLLSGFYFCVGKASPTARIAALLPTSVRAKLPLWRRRLCHVSLRYLRAYLTLFFLCAVELLIGFLLLRVEYAFLLALLVSIVDLLPVLGVGSVLLPWATVALIKRNFPLGFGLLILYLTVTVLRQIAEPRILGGSLGLSPLFTLVTGYACYRLFGVLGFLLSPFVALLLKTLWLQWHPEQRASREASRTVEKRTCKFQ